MLLCFLGSDCSIPICFQGYFDPLCKDSIFAVGGEGCYRCPNGGVCGKISALTTFALESHDHYLSCPRYLSVRFLHLLLLSLILYFFISCEDGWTGTKALQTIIHISFF